MTRQIRRSLFYAAVIALLSAPPVLAGAVQVGWTPGWDVCASSPTSGSCDGGNVNEQLNFGMSKVIYNHPGSTSSLQINYQLKGARANESYPVGIILFWSSTL